MQIDSVAQGRSERPAAPPPQPVAQAARQQAAAVVVAIERVQDNPSPPPPQDNKAAMQSAVASINRYLQENNKNVQFDIDHSTGKTVIRVVDAVTQEVVRQMPSEETLAIARAISRMSGMLLAEKA